MLGVRPEEVLVVPQLEPIDLDETVRVLVGARKTSGDFVLYVSIVPQWSPVDLGDEFEVMFELCRLWKCESLVSSDSPSPYSWILLDDKGGRRDVTLDADELDERERYVLSSSAPPNDGSL
ncbi:hypothetical protein DAT35_14540 [Vitiosangium sp. GDMCC 1.1324]|nr:hypothetical protein DAT35_14540 [Vitiosangium sp. GDMCC 1.1324]